MSKTLYDLLEVNTSASGEAIAASYKRLHTKYMEQASAGDPDATNQMIALREAYSILSDPTRRRQYDLRLASRETDSFQQPQPASSRLQWIILAIVLAVGAVGYQKHRAEEEQARLAAEQAHKEAEEAAAAARLAEIEAQRQRDEQYATQRREAIERAKQMQEQAYSNHVSYELARAEADARRSKDYQERQRMLAEQQKQNDAERQLARERAYLRQIESENRRYGY